jgi:hypothetical protein
MDYSGMYDDSWMIWHRLGHCATAGINAQEFHQFMTELRSFRVYCFEAMVGHYPSYTIN